MPLGPAHGVSFDQVGFDFGGGLAYPFSPTGRLQVRLTTLCESMEQKRGYINVVTDHGWVVVNLLADCQELVQSPDATLAAYFELRDINDHTTRVDELPATVLFSGIPPPILSVDVKDQVNFQIPHTVQFRSGGCMDVRVNALPNPPSPMVGPSSGGPTDSHILPNPVNVEAAKGQCFPVSVANSLQYLEARYGLPVPNDHVPGFKGDNTLVGVLDTKANRPASSRRSGDGTPFQSMMRGKLEYLDENDLEDGVVMRHQGRGYGAEALEDGDFSIGAVFTVTSKDDGPEVTWEWICDQIKAGEDVELAYSWDRFAGSIGGGHAVRVYGCGRTNGKPWVKYLHDRDQDDDSAGLETVQVYLEDLDGDGRVNFGARHREVVFAWSESASDALKSGDFAPPQTTAESILNAASFLDKKLTGGAIGTVFGVFRDLATGGNLTEEGPAQIAGLQVLVNGIEAPVFFSNGNQVNFQVPAEIEPGMASLVITVDGRPSDLVGFPVVESAPGIFILSESVAGPGRAVAQNADFSLNLPSAPAPVGGAIVLYLTGTGALEPPVPTGEPAPASPLSQLALETTATIGGVPAQVLFAGASPGFIGLTQVNLAIPELAPGDHPVVVTVGGVDSNELLVAVGPAAP